MTRSHVQRYALATCPVLVGSAGALQANGPSSKLQPRAVFYTPHPPYHHATRHFGLEFSVTLRVTWAAASPVQEVKVIKSCGDTGSDNYTLAYIKKYLHSTAGEEVTHKVTLNYVLRRPGARG